ncbi:uncharacterized protein LOC131613147 [Vicia villosa]|uniref:uncharacterized protein LOC131613147 n=1 Tax=Vicia villosa TaxID=3911 RepID=UPI00273BE5DF|nr:uncharacterized protein LOC131613147 [Vicia villosa]
MQMADQDRSKERASKNRHSKHSKRLNMNSSILFHTGTSQRAPISRTLHDTTLHETSHIAPQHSTSHVVSPYTSSVPPPSNVPRAPPSNTYHVEPPHKTFHVPPPPKTSRVPLPKTSRVPPLKTSHAARPPNTSHAQTPYNTSHVAPPSSTSHVAPSRPFNVTRTHVVPPTRTSTIPSTSASHVTPPSRTSQDTPSPYIRGVVSPSNSQPSHSEEEHTPRSSETVVASETQSNNFKRTLYLDGNGFLPSHPAAKEIGDIMKSNYFEAWHSWKKIDIKKRDIWFAEFQINDIRIVIETTPSLPGQTS